MTNSTNDNNGDGNYVYLTEHSVATPTIGTYKSFKSSNAGMNTVMMSIGSTTLYYYKKRVVGFTLKSELAGTVLNRSYVLNPIAPRLKKDKEVIGELKDYCGGLENATVSLVGSIKTVLSLLRMFTSYDTDIKYRIHYAGMYGVRNHSERRNAIGRVSDQLTPTGEKTLIDRPYRDNPFSLSSEVHLLSGTASQLQRNIDYILSENVDFDVKVQQKQPM